MLNFQRLWLQDVAVYAENGESQVFRFQKAVLARCPCTPGDGWSKGWSLDLNLLGSCGQDQERV